MLNESLPRGLNLILNRGTSTSFLIPFWTLISFPFIYMLRGLQGKPSRSAPLRPGSPALETSHLTMEAYNKQFSQPHIWFHLCYISHCVQNANQIQLHNSRWRRSRCRSCLTLVLLPFLLRLNPPDWSRNRRILQPTSHRNQECFWRDRFRARLIV